MKAGDRVRYRANTIGKWYNRDLVGATGTIIDHDPLVPERFKVKWDYTRFAKFAPFAYNLELIMPTIDTTKPLELVNILGEALGEVPFITLTSEGHILVGKREGGLAAWHIFTTEGQFVRNDGEGGNCDNLTLRNKVVETTYFRTIGTNGDLGSSNYTSLTALKSYTGPNYPAAKFTVRDGELVSMEIVR